MPGTSTAEATGLERRGAGWRGRRAIARPGRGRGGRAGPLFVGARGRRRRPRPGREGARHRAPSTRRVRRRSSATTCGSCSARTRARCSGCSRTTPRCSAIVSLAVIGLIVAYHARVGRQRLPDGALGLLLGGAIGNMLDRLRLGYVVDFVDVGIGSTRFYTFNVADAAISLAILLLLRPGHRPAARSRRWRRRPTPTPSRRCLRSSTSADRRRSRDR